MRTIPRGALLAYCLLLGGCATMANRGHIRTVPGSPEQPQAVRVARVWLENLPGHAGVLSIQRRDIHFLLPGELTVISNGRPLEIRQSDRSERFRGFCLEGARTQAQREACARALYFPYIELPKGSAHTLELQHMDGRRATVTVRASWRPAWLFANWVWFAAAPIGWAVDGVTGSWTYFGDLDVSRAFGASSSASAGTR